jgi:hypothetical protein
MRAGKEKLRAGLLREFGLEPDPQWGQVAAPPPSGGEDEEDAKQDRNLFQEALVVMKLVQSDGQSKTINFLTTTDREPLFPR